MEDPEMSRNKNIPFKSQGVSSLTKNISALDPNSFGLDERTVPDLMNFILNFSEQVQYKNLKNKKDGNWSVFFEDDLAFLLAEIYNSALHERDASF